MELKNAKCPNCGATIKVNPGATTAICRYCESEYEVESAINTYNIEHQIIENQKVEGKVNIGTQIVQNQTVIHTVTRPRKIITLPKDVDISVYKELRYDLIDRRTVENDTRYEYVFEREDHFSNDHKLIVIENKIDGLVNRLNQCETSKAELKKKNGTFIAGFIFLIFIPIVGWFILFVGLISFLCANSARKKTLNKEQEDIKKAITKHKVEWIEKAKEKGLLN